MKALAWTYQSTKSNQDLRTLMYAIKRFIRMHPLAYDCVCTFRSAVLGKDARLANRHTGLCIEGYPSSGNTIAYHLAKGIWPQLTIASHRHSVAAVKHALFLNVPAILLIREPRDAISSYVVRFGVSLQLAVWEYLDLYEWAARADGVVVVNFDTLLKEPVLFVQMLGAMMGRAVPESDPDLKQKLLDLVHEQLKSDDIPPAQSRQPHAVKDALKAEIKLVLEKDVRNLQRIIAVYQNLCAKGWTIPGLPASE